jgi:hypothetical protein
MGCSHFCNEKKYVGNVIFRKIEYKFEKTGNDELDKMFSEAGEVLKNSEEIRMKIADKFRNILIATGTCVLKRPTFERSVSSFVIQILIEIYKDIGNDKNKLKQFEFSSLFQFSTTAPYMSYNQNKAKELRESLKIDIEDNRNLMNAKQSIYEFIESICLLKDSHNEIWHGLHSLYQGIGVSLRGVKGKITPVEGSNLNESVDFIKKSESNLEHISDLKNVLSLIKGLIYEVYNATSTIVYKVLHPNEMDKWHRIALDALEKKIFDPKEVVFYYAKDEKIKRIQDWETNLCYKEEEDELKF